MKGIIYLITNKITGKMYVGQTTRGLNRRWKDHCNVNSRCGHVSRAIREYGENLFYVDQIDSGENLDELNYKEEYWIVKLNTLFPNGYNTYANSKSPSNSARNKMSQANLGNKKGVGRKVSDEAKLKISRKNKETKSLAEIKMKMSQAAIKRGSTLTEAGKHRIILASISKKRSQKKYKGVYKYNSKLNPFMACYHSNHKQIFIGAFKTDIDAALAYDRAIIEYRGGQGYLNFPDAFKGILI